MIIGVPSVTNSKKAVDVAVAVVVVVAGVVVIVVLAVTADADAVGLMKGLTTVEGRTGAEVVVEEGGGGGELVVVVVVWGGVVVVVVGVVVEVVVVEVGVVLTVGIAVVVVDRRGAEGDAVVRDIWRTARSDLSIQARDFGTWVNFYTAQACMDLIHICTRSAFFCAPSGAKHYRFSSSVDSWRRQACCGWSPSGMLLPRRAWKPGL